MNNQPEEIIGSPTLATYGDPGISLRQELNSMRDDLQKLCAVMRELVKLQAIANQKLETAINGKPIFEVTR
jgi:hypothetical protein